MQFERQQVYFQAPNLVWNYWHVFVAIYAVASAIVVNFGCQLLQLCKLRLWCFGSYHQFIMSTLSRQGGHKYHQIYLTHSAVVYWMAISLHSELAGTTATMCSKHWSMPFLWTGSPSPSVHEGKGAANSTELQLAAECEPGRTAQGTRLTKAHCEALCPVLLWAETCPWQRMSRIIWD